MCVEKGSILKGHPQGQAYPCLPELHDFSLMRGKLRFKELYSYILSMKVKHWNDWQFNFHATYNLKNKNSLFFVIYLQVKAFQGFHA